MKRYHKVSEVAEIFGVHPDTVKKWCINGDIDASNVGGTWFIPIEAVEAYNEGIKPKRVVMLEKEKERLEERIVELENTMKKVAGTLLERSN